jgi:hypothetical protein
LRIATNCDTNVDGRIRIVIRNNSLPIRYFVYLYKFVYWYIIRYMLFMGKKNKKRIELIWSIISILVVISMVLLYMPIFN